MPRNNLQEPLEPFPSALNHLVAEPIREHFPRQSRDVDAIRLALENVPEVLEIAVAPSDGRVAYLKGRDVGLGRAMRGSVGVCRKALKLHSPASLSHSLYTASCQIHAS